MPPIPPLDPRRFDPDCRPVPLPPPSDPRTAKMARVAVAEARNGRETLAGAVLPFTADGERVTDALGTSWESPAGALVMEVLGLCGCGYADTVERDVARLLAGVEAGRSLPELAPGVGGEMYREVLLHLLTDAGLLEHGSSVAGSWRTELGDRWLAALS